MRPSPSRISKYPISIALPDMERLLPKSWPLFEAMVWGKSRTFLQKAAVLGGLLRLTAPKGTGESYVVQGVCSAPNSDFRFLPARMRNVVASHRRVRGPYGPGHARLPRVRLHTPRPVPRRGAPPRRLVVPAGAGWRCCDNGRGKLFWLPRV